MLERIASGPVDPRAPLLAPPRLVTPVDRTFVGRREELARLRTGIDAALQGHGSLFLVSGEAGAGKTRLASELAVAASGAGLTVVWGRCWEAGGAPSYWPWIEVIRALVAGQAELDLGSRGSFLAQLVPELADRFGAGSVVAPAPSDPESARFLMFDAVNELVRRCARLTPLLLVFDDLHRADPASLLLLSFLARRSADVPLLLAGTLRDEEADRGANLLEPLAHLSRGAVRIELGGLSRSDIAALFGAMTGSDASDELTSRIHDATEGNALFVDEVLRSLVDADARRGDGSTTHDLRIPTGVRDALRLRLASMSPSSVAVLEVAAVVGRGFAIPILARALRQSPGAVLAALGDPTMSAIVTEADRPGCFQFRHALIRDALYDSLPATRRLELHQEVGEAFEAVESSVPDHHLGELAHHFLAAAARGDGRFVKHASRAARRALTQMAFEDAVTLHTRTLQALVHVPPDEHQRCQILLSLAEAKEWANDPIGSRACFAEAAEIARRLDATDLLVRAALGVGGVAARKFTATSRCDTAPALLREALQRVPDDDVGSRAQLLSRLALHELSAESRSAALALSAEAVGLARTSLDREALGQALIARHAVLLGPDAMVERLAIAKELVTIGVELPSRDLELRGHALQFTVAFELGHMEEAQRALDRHGSLADWAHDPFERWVNLVWRAAMALHAGAFDEGERQAQAAAALVGTTPGPHNEELYGPASALAQALIVQEARGIVDLDPTTVQHFRGSYHEVSIWRVIWLGQLTKLAQTEAVVRELDVVMAHGLRDFVRNALWLASMSFVTEAIELAGASHHAAILYPLLQPFAEHNVSSSHLASRGSVSRYLALLAATLERWGLAEQHFAAAIEGNLRMHARPFVARSRYDWARLLERRGDPDSLAKARSLLRDATAEAVELGMLELVDKCRTLHSRIADEAAGGSAAAEHGVLLIRQGEVWTLRHAGTDTPIRHSKGVAYIAELLRHPDREILAINLLKGLAGELGGTASVVARDDPSVSAPRRGYFADDVFDARARRAYAARVDEMECELSRAEADGDPERVLELRDELARLERELARGIGLGGRSRKVSDVERARISVTRAIRLALGRIAEAAPDAGRVLGLRIRTGTYCCYAATEPRRPRRDAVLLGS
jgi:hypothetical protein